MTATAADYVWLNERFPDLAEAYCFTLVHNLAPVDVLARLEGQSEPSQTGVEAIVDAAFELLDRSDNTRQFIAMTTVGDWTLLIEPVGYIGVTEERALPASAGTRWVSHFVNINGLDSFLWAQDTAGRLTFEPAVPDRRWGTTPDEPVPVPPHEIRIDMGSSKTIAGFAYLPRQDGSINGRVGQYEFYVSSDGTTWGSPVATGTFADDSSRKTVGFPPTATRYIRFRALTAVDGGPYTTCATLSVIGS
ncbi:MULTISPECIES: DUF6461 domain-containing protein [unclassified Streptomyces]|uniref:DUF6461 domain-containing protein n=1 Tax=unclassified Streptomyces TaxID=2593676 RepID=UPI002256B69F|nr:MULTISPECIES: DUF6461 domain-containing protein [unclassified Streptomyces]WSP53752.1 discoidin domain-containing protein [Streptomyces sp. NBC_01241]WSU25579.1 discoidin domain-containing protein [Streptomyces sp. NBC_01108]MCX4785156.1 discoidin domain-containing protein [Streptomyces sp. NBC_01221]MCX4798903.1 discoidin domain-containing protein [Streptomyces sp. NBC_01242]WSJ40104.1 discoidin domain-containing protein [Streptomyces sp. NBC_01321]